MVTITKYVWDTVSDCVLSELDENNAVTAVYTNEPQQYGGVLSQRRGTTSHHHHHDALGSTRFLTDSAGNVTDTYLHDAWGNSVASTGTTVNPFRWVGKYGYYTDDSTGQVYVRARMYMPTVARWCSVDPLWKKFRTGFWEYGHNSPIAMTDESGLEVPTYNPRDVSICKEKLELVAKTGWGYFPLAAGLLERFLAGGGDVYLENWFFDMRDRVETIRPAIFLAIAKTLRPVCDYSSSITFDNEKAEIAFPKGSKLGNDLFWAINRAHILLSGNAEIECGKSMSIHFLIPDLRDCCCRCRLTGSVGGELQDTYDFCSSYKEPKSILGKVFDFPRCACILEDWAKKHPTEAKGRYKAFAVRIKIKPEPIEGSYYACLSSGTIRNLFGNVWASDERVE